MMPNWRKVTISDLCEGIYDGPHATPEKTSKGPVFLGISCLRKGRLDLSEAEHLSEEDFEKWTRRVTPEPGDVVFSYETRLGQAAIIPEGLRCCLGRRMGLLRPDRSRTHPRFLLYAYLSPQFQAVLRRRAVQGSTVNRILLTELPEFPISVPPLAEQKAIAHVLGTLDDKIELNRRMNETLEAMARAIFKSWFVEFDPVIDNALRAGNPIPDKLADRAAARQEALDAGNPIVPDDTARLFPDSFQESDLGPIPATWKVNGLYSLIDIIGGGTPKTSVDEYWGGSIPWFSLVDAPEPTDVFAIDTERRITESGVENSSTKILPAGTTIISARGTVGKCAVVGRPMAMNQSCYGVRGAQEIGDYFVYFTLRHKVADLQRKSHGSVFNTITRNTFKSIRVPTPFPEVMETFENVVSVYMDNVLANLKQSDTLRRVRDAFLPELLSGRLNAPNTGGAQ